ncbi:MAG: nucleotidyltransferase family protein [Acidimicrobiia bacterium]|nr:nucleotidyltransferase family protein [Acidimicrobiia bacterium]
MAADAGREIAVLRRAARTDADPSELRDLAAAGVDWPRLLEVAGVHGIKTLLWWALSQAGDGAVPPEAAGHLQDFFHRNAAHGLLMQREAIRLLDLFGGHAISAIPYKGPILASSVYGNVALRTYDDLDIVVRPRDVDRALELLLDDGYTLVHTGDERARDEAHRWNHTLRRADGRVTVELHWTFAPKSWRFLRDIEPLWSRLERWDVGGGVQVEGMSAEDLLTVLCVHGAKHWWVRLLWVADIAELVRLRPAMDWDGLLDRARGEGALRLTLIGLALAEEVLDAPLPHVVRDEIRRDPRVRAVSARLRESLLVAHPVEQSGRPASKLYRAMRERRREQLAYLVYPNEEDLASVSLPAGLTGLYWAVRPVKLATKYVVEPVGRVARSLRSSRS